MDHLYTNIAVIYRGFCENLYGPLASLAVKNMYWNFQPCASALEGGEKETEGQRENEMKKCVKAEYFTNT